jgi:acyl-CoA dehydrogenase
MSFVQAPPELPNQYDADGALRALLDRLLPEDVRGATEGSLREMGRLSAELYPEQLADLPSEPRLVQWDAWGNRVDRVELTPLWRRAARIAAEHGVVATAYERAHGPYSRIHQLALAYLFTPSTDIYACPLAMSDGAASTLLGSGNRALIERAVPRLTSRDPDACWTSGQWMTETSGGSDVSGTETVARPDGSGGWTLHGRKWFTSAATAQMALTLARPEGNPPGNRGLALFYLETLGADGALQGIRIDRLKEKLGTRKLPTAELTLDGVPARPVLGLTDGVRNITPVLNLTRTWNAVSACALMRRGLALACAYAAGRRAFGRPLSEHPLHVETLAGMSAEFRGALQLTFRVAALLGQREAGELDGAGGRLLRVLTPLAKLTTGRQAVAVSSEVVEAFGGAGYLEDTGIPMLLRDAQVLSIWEGTTNVLALDLLRATEEAGGPGLLAEEVARALPASGGDAAAAALAAVEAASAWWEGCREDRPALEAGARRFALTVGRALEAALLLEQAAWEEERGGGEASAAAARRLMESGGPTPSRQGGAESTTR